MAKRKSRKPPRRKRPNRRAPGARAAKARVAKTRGQTAGEKAAVAARARSVLAGIAHDIRTPLTGIAALAELLASSDLGTRERDWANAIKSGADHLAAIASLIVDAAKAGATGLILRNEPFSPRMLAEAVGHGLTARAGNKDIKAEFAIAAAAGAGRRRCLLRLRAVLENLVDNAMKFTSEGTVVIQRRRRAGQPHACVSIFTVTDTGIGMDPRDIKKLFRPFAQASESVARRYGGAGLGLVFVKRVAEAMQGNLDVTSEARTRAPLSA